MLGALLADRSEQEPEEAAAPTRAQQHLRCGTLDRLPLDLDPGERIGARLP
jgi:hypothetical protein